MSKRARDPVEEPPTKVARTAEPNVFVVILTQFVDDYKMRHGCSASEIKEVRVCATEKEAWAVQFELEMEIVMEELFEGEQLTKKQLDKYRKDGGKEWDKEKIKEDLEELWDLVVDGEYVSDCYSFEQRSFTLPH
jgi:hypothetical protein